MAEMGMKILMEAVESKQNGSTTAIASTPSSKAEPIPTSTDNNSTSTLVDSSLDSTDISSTGTTGHQSKFDSPAKTIDNQPSTPLTPTANLKMLVAAASSALDREIANNTTIPSKQSGNATDKDEEGSSRKMKSLSLLCRKFLQVADEEIGPGKEFSLEMMSNSLGINRRRIYDIINVLEALEMISKQSKNWYLWHGQSNLVTTLAKLKAMATDDPDIQPFLNVNQTENDKENDRPSSNASQNDTSQANKLQDNAMDDEDDDEDGDVPAAARSVRYDKSLGVLCQKFVMLFLISACTEITLEEAGKVLVPDYHDDTLYMALNPPVNPKTKIRRLYDIANILSSLGLIKKKVFIGPHHVKKPGYAWSGPSLKDIESIAVARKNEYTLNKGLLRRSISSRPYLHQYEVQNSTSESAPSSPNVNTSNAASNKFKRSLSFGGNVTNSTSSSTSVNPKQVVARPLCPKQVDYLREMKEFESEMQKHSHRYPHVASIFHEFIQKYQTTMEQTASANGRYILPKAANPTATTIQNNTVPTQPDIVAQRTVQHATPIQDTSTSDISIDRSPSIATTHNVTAVATNHPSVSVSISDLPSCRYEVIPTPIRVEQPIMFDNIKQQLTNDVPRESCAIKQKQKVLQRMVMSNNNSYPSQDLPITHVITNGPVALPVSHVSNASSLIGQPPSTPTTSSIVTNNLVNNIASTLLVNVLHGNMLTDATTTTVPSNVQRCPPTVSHKPGSGFINIDELLVKPITNEQHYLKPTNIGFLTSSGTAASQLVDNICQQNALLTTATTRLGPQCQQQVVAQSHHPFNPNNLLAAGSTRTVDHSLQYSIDNNESSSNNNNSKRPRLE